MTENVIDKYMAKTNSKGREEGCINIMTHLRTLIFGSHRSEPLVDLDLLSNLAHVSTDCGARVMLAFDQLSHRFVVVKEYLHEEGTWFLPKHVLRQLEASIKVQQQKPYPKCLQCCIDVQIVQNVTHLMFPYYPFRFDQLFGLNQKPHAFATEKTIELLHAVEILHAAGVAHRDIKAGNICFDRRGRLVLIDFDSAVSESLDMRRTVPCCSLITRAPEQIVAELHRETKVNGYDAKAGDWWAVGCVVSEMFLGHSLFNSLAGEYPINEFFDEMCTFSAHLSQWRSSPHAVVKALRRCVDENMIELLCGLLQLDCSKRHFAVLEFFAKQTTEELVPLLSSMTLKNEV